MTILLNYFQALLLVAFEADTSLLDYPGFEVWKFVNLAIFIGAAIYLHQAFGKPVSEALRNRKERIKAELEAARQERDKALARLAEVEARLNGLQNETAAIRERAVAEAKAEQLRIQQVTEAEVAKLRESAQREIQSAGKAATAELRRFAAEQSVRLAADYIRKDIGPEDEARLLTLRPDQFGGRKN